MIDVKFLKTEALILRNAINACDKDETTIITKSFPIQNCELASLLLAFHYRQLWKKIEITFVYGSCENNVRHVWLETGGYVIDITGDQYNLMDDDELNVEVIKHRPYPEVHVETKSKSYFHQMFNCSAPWILGDEFSNLKKPSVRKLVQSYNLLQDDLDINRSKINYANNMP